jgi:hypothetical protein
MKKIMAALLMIVVALAVSPAMAASKRVKIIDEIVVKELPPVKQRPLEIGSIHEAYLNDHCLIGTLLLRGENRQAVLNLAAKRGATLVLVDFSNWMVDKKETWVSRYESAGAGKMRTTWTTGIVKAPGFYVELFAPGVDYREGARRFCANRCGTIEELKRYLNLGVDPDVLLESLVNSTGTHLADWFLIKWVPTMEAQLEMIALTLSSGASGKEAAKKANDNLARYIKKHGYALPYHYDEEVVWPIKHLPANSSGIVRGSPAFIQAWLAKIRQMIYRHAGLK